MPNEIVETPEQQEPQVQDAEPDKKEKKTGFLEGARFIFIVGAALIIIILLILGLVPYLKGAVLPNSGTTSILQVNAITTSVTAPSTIPSTIQPHPTIYSTTIFSTTILSSTIPVPGGFQQSTVSSITTSSTTTISSINSTSSINTTSTSSSTSTTTSSSTSSSSTTTGDTTSTSVTTTSSTTTSSSTTVPTSTSSSTSTSTVASTTSSTTSTIPTTTSTVFTTTSTTSSTVFTTTTSTSTTSASTSTSTSVTTTGTTIVYSYGQTTGSGGAQTSLTLASGYTDYICGAATESYPVTSWSWISDVETAYDNIGHQSSNLCSATSSQYFQLAGIGANAQYSLQTSGEPNTGAFSFLYSVTNPSQSTIIIATTYYEASPPTVPSGCSVLVNAAIEIVECSGQSAGTYMVTINGDAYINGEQTYAVYVS